MRRNRRSKGCHHGRGDGTNADETLKCAADELGSRSPANATMEGAYGLPSGRPIEQGTMPQGGPHAGQPYSVYNLSAPAGGTSMPTLPPPVTPGGLPPIPRPSGAVRPTMPAGYSFTPSTPALLPGIPSGMASSPPAVPQRSDYYPTLDDPVLPVRGGPIARQGSFYFPSTPIGRMEPYEARAQVRSMYGRDGDANWYASSPAPRQPIDQVLTPAERGMLDRDSNAGPFGTLGGSAGRFAAMRQAVQQQGMVQGGGPAHRPWDPALMAQIEAQSANRELPANVAAMNQSRIRSTPQYQANRALQQEYNQTRDQRLAANRRDAALARGAARSRMLGIPLPPAQADMLARARGAQAGQGFEGGTQIAGTGLNAPPRPFSALQPVETVALTPERRQQLLEMLNRITPETPIHEIQRMRGTIQPGELDALQAELAPSSVVDRHFGQTGAEYGRLKEGIDYLKLGPKYTSPQKRKESFQRVWNEYGNSGWAN